MIHRLRRWWQIRTGKLETPFDTEVPFWGLSLIFHLALIVLFAKVVMPEDADNRVAFEAAPIEDVIELAEMVEPEMEFAEIETDEVGSTIEDPLEAAMDAPEMEVIAEEPIDVFPDHDIGDVYTSDDDFQAAADSGTTSVAVRGTVGQSVNSARGAVDRVADEILLKLDEGPTLVIWLFDQSASLMEQRDQIAQRFDNIYGQLHQLQQAGDEKFTKHKDIPLLTQVYQFGKDVNPILKQPSDDLDKLKEAVASVKQDKSGIENTMTAVMAAASKYRSFAKIDRDTKKRERNVMIILVTDEAGDDRQRTDEAIRVCRNTGTNVFVIGVPAPFGRPVTLVKWVDPDPEFDQTPQFAEVNQGPESVRSERLRLDFTGQFDDLEMMDSGFGPFHLTRLSYETGGLYFAVHPNRDDQRSGRPLRLRQTRKYSAHLSYFFDSELMRRYRPDYISEAAYDASLQNNAARFALVKAAHFTTTGQLESPVLRFEKLDEARFVNQVSQAQRAAAYIEPAINQLYGVLKAGEADRAKEISPRWQAGYDLAMGRTMAAKIRAEAYNMMLAMAKTKLKFDPPKGDRPQNNTWVLRPADTISTGSAQEKLAIKARTYLEKVVSEHPDTPWALLAERELKTPIGWEWKQTYTKPPEPREMAMNNNNNNNVPPERRPQMNAQPKEKRPVPKL
jgi:hypothetical protein